MLPRWRSTVAPARRRGALPLAGRSHMSAASSSPLRVQLRHGPAFDVTDRYRMTPIRRRAAAARAAGRRPTGGQATPRAAPTAPGDYHVRSARRRSAPPPAPRRRGVAPLAGCTCVAPRGNASAPAIRANLPSPWTGASSRWPLRAASALRRAMGTPGGCATLLIRLGASSRFSRPCTSP
jgi:hypothetical protein